VPLRAFTREHADGIIAKLPSALKKATRRHVAQLVSRVLRLAVFTDTLKVSPLPPGWLPKAPKAESIAKESLLPSEEAKLLTGRDADGKTVVPLGYRVAYAFLHREGMRKGEARALVWGDVHLANGVVSLDEDKTERPRSRVLDPGVRRVLEHWKKVNGKAKDTGPVFVDVAWGKLAPIYRAHCEAVGIKRERLYQKKANKLRLRAHDMSAFFVTAAMFDEHDALWITDRSGHTTLGMLRTYERDVRRWRELGDASGYAAAGAGSKKQPLFLLGCFGGATRLAIEQLLPSPAREVPDNAEVLDEMRRRGRAHWSGPGATAALRTLAADGIGTALGHRLSDDENGELFFSSDVSRLVALILEGLGRCFRAG
jgi:integrase